MECSMLHPSLFLVVNDLLKTQVRNRFFVLLYLLLVFQIEQSIFRNNNFGIDVYSVVFDGWIFRIFFESLLVL